MRIAVVDQVDRLVRRGLGQHLALRPPALVAIRQMRLQPVAGAHLTPPSHAAAVAQPQR